jgi:RNA polymerase sigma factor (sigma-70 family)
MALTSLFRRRSDASAQEFERLVREHVTAFYRTAYRWTGSVERAEDLVQDLLVRLYPRLDELRTIDLLRPWATRVMYRIFIDQLRRERNAPVQYGSDPAVDEPETQFTEPEQEPPELVERELTQDRVLTAWEQLSEEHRVVLSMHDIEGYSLVELASLMDLPVGTLKSRVHRARARLRELLSRERFADAARV